MFTKYASAVLRGQRLYRSAWIAQPPPLDRSARLWISATRAGAAAAAVVGAAAATAAGAKNLGKAAQLVLHKSERLPRRQALCVARNLHIATLFVRHRDVPQIQAAFEGFLACSRNASRARRNAADSVSAQCCHITPLTRADPAPSWRPPLAAGRPHLHQMQ